MADRRVAVFGLGYVGLPLIQACVNAGHEVVGFDVDSTVVEGLAAGRSHVDDISDEAVASWRAKGFRATSKEEELHGVDVFIICVPTPLASDESPDLAAVRAACQVIARRMELPRKPLVVLESTTYPGTTEEIVKPLIEAGGGSAGIDFALAFSPERIDPGNAVHGFGNTPKIVGGLTDECADRAEAFYATVTQRVVRTRGLKEAEMAKLLENTYRHVNIALVNELAKISHLLGIDFWDVISAAETKPYGFHAFRPGPGVGGHCIPIDPRYLGHRVRTELGQTLRFVELAQEINASMPGYLVQRVCDLLAANAVDVSGSTVLLLGVTYKPNIADLRESPARDVVRELRGRGARVLFHDPLIAELTVDGQPVVACPDLASAVAAADCTVLLQMHRAYAREAAVLARSRLLFDAQGQLRSVLEGQGLTWTTL